jgi:hypothetical protein
MALNSEIKFYRKSAEFVNVTLYLENQNDEKPMIMK